MARRQLLDVPALRPTTLPSPARRVAEAPATKPLETATPVTQQAPAHGDTQTFKPEETPVSLYGQSTQSTKSSATRSASFGWETADTIADQRATAWKSNVAKAGARTTVALGDTSVELRSTTGQGLTTAELIDEIASTDGGRALLSAPDLSLENASLAFVPASKRGAFEDAYLKATGEPLPNDLSATVLWVKGDDGKATPLIAVPEWQPLDKLDVTEDLRHELDFRDEDHARPTRTAAVLSRAKAATASGDFDQMRASLRELLRADVSDVKVGAALDELTARLTPLRASTGRTVMEAGSFSGLVKKHFDKVQGLRESKADAATLKREQAELDRLYAVDDRLLSGATEAAGRRHRLRGLVDAAPAPAPGERRPQWFQELKAQLPTESRALFEGFEKYGRADADGWKPPAKLAPAYDRAMAKANDPKQFEQWLGRFMDRVADKMASSDHPVVQEHWHNKRFSPAVIDQVLEEMAKEQGFGGLFNIESGGKIIDHEEFGKILEDRKLILDPYHTVDRGRGAHGRVVHAMEWLYLSQNEPDVVKLYQAIGSHTREARADINKGQEGYVWKELNEFYTRRNWLFTPDNFTPFVSDFTGAD